MKLHKDVTQGIDNSMYAITDAGRLYKISKHKKNLQSGDFFYV
ncbi:hypothetical protein SAMN05421796_102317 [Chryseobacterium piscicola]|jgi:hypothetical protein|uniref:Uncharacterized protein n=1 Tax=Chryseobacterium piscicola TaxID=551459 RepID=A0A1N7LH31_9FLAO|nr:hypothetical protein [Chryseobacterium piscicola]SIS73148.1 hypothetical protein SAMN05421796_102317 [Chryseobacterium piscicola]